MPVSHFETAVRIILLSIACLFISACANKPLLVKKSTEIHSLQLCINFAEHIEGNEKLLYLDAIKTFMDDYNAQQRGLALQPCTKGQQQSLMITVQNTRLVTPNKQLLYVVISTIGIAYPLSGGSFGFAWFAMNGTNLQLQLSPDVGVESKPVYRYFSSWPYFYDLESIKVKHMKQFQEFMFETIVTIEKSLESPQM